MGSFSKETGVCCCNTALGVAHMALMAYFKHHTVKPVWRVFTPPPPHQILSF